MVGLHGVFSVTGSFFGLPITIKVLASTNLHGNSSSLIFSNINKVVFVFDSTSSSGFSNDLECDVLPAK